MKGSIKFWPCEACYSTVPHTHIHIYIYIYRSKYTKII